MENMDENQELRLASDTSRNANNEEKTNNEEDNNKLEDIQIKNDDESIAFKLQFDEILIATKLLENAKANKNNRHYYPHARTNSLPSLNSRRIPEIENSYFTHQRSYSHNHHNNNNQMKHKRSNPLAPKLNLNGISNHSYYPSATTNRNDKMNPLPSTPYIGYDIFDEMSFDDAFDLRTSLKEFDYKFNNNRYDSDWDSLSSNQGYRPFTPSSSSTSYSPSLSPYYHPTSRKSSNHQHHHWFLDDKEYLAQQLLLEEERKLLELQQIQLNDAIAAHQLLLKSEANNNNNNLDPLLKLNLVQTPAMPTASLTSSALNSDNSKYKSNTFLHHKSSSSSSTTSNKTLNHFSSSSSSSSSSSLTSLSSCSPSPPSSQLRNYQEPIGTPIRKPSPSNSNNNNKHNVKPISISNAPLSSFSSQPPFPSLSPSSSSSSFSLFSKSPPLSINTNANDNLSPEAPSSMPITPTTPNNNNSYFGSFSLNVNPKPRNHNYNFNNKYHHNLFYNSSVTATTFDEREEDLFLWSNESFNKEFERPLQLNNNHLKFHRGHYRHSSELV